MIFSTSGNCYYTPADNPAHGGHLPLPYPFYFLPKSEAMKPEASISLTTLLS